MELDFDGSFHLDRAPLDYVWTVTPLFNGALGGFDQHWMTRDRFEIVDQSIFADRGLEYNVALNVAQPRLVWIDRIDLMQQEALRYA